MSGDRKKMGSKKGTGTVPKIKYQNNTSQLNRDDPQHNILSNNLGLEWQRQEYFGLSRNPGRNLNPFHTSSMEAPVEFGQNRGHLNTLGNEILSTPNTSGSTSRCDSVGAIPKCDNVAKYPDKKQIEDKLDQIREYLHATTSLMTSIKNGDEQSDADIESLSQTLKDLKDSETKLLVLLVDASCESEKNAEPEEAHDMDLVVSEHMQRFCQLLDVLACEHTKYNNVHNTNIGIVENDNVSEPSTSGYQSNLSRNELEEKVEQSSRKIQILREHQNALLNLQHRAENQLRDARQAQEKLLLAHQIQKCGNSKRSQERASIDSQMNDICCLHLTNNENNFSENRFDKTIRELEERLQSLQNESQLGRTNNQSRPSSSNVNENLQAEVEFLQERIENNNHLLQILGNHDVQLNSEHMELQGKLNELQAKKLQIDQLTMQLEDMNDEVEEDDLGAQVRKIVSMKDQLSKLKDMLEMVKGTEVSLLAQNVRSSEENVNLPSKTDNLHQNEIRHNQMEQAEFSRTVNNTPPRQNKSDKQSNKSILSSKERERLMLQAELQAKKKELEEIMYKRRDCVSNINNDVCSEISTNKSEHGTFEGATPTNPWFIQDSTEPYSSDEAPEEDINTYSELNSGNVTNIRNIPPQPVITTSYSTPNLISKRKEEIEPRQYSEYSDRARQLPSRTPERSTRSASLGMPDFAPSPANLNSEQDTQKQLHLIQNLVQSLLEQQQLNQQQTNVLHNNLTPSPLYTEPRQFTSPHAHSVNALNVCHRVSEVPWSPSTQQCFPSGDFGNCQNLLTANTLQMQSFMLSTLNQCCQMLWFQQREISGLRNMLSSMQEQHGMYNQNPNIFSPQTNTTPHYMCPLPIPTSNLAEPFLSPQSRAVNSKINQPAACTVSNSSQNRGSQTNTENAFLNQSNAHSTPSARLLEVSLNNMAASVHNHLSTSDEQGNNNLLTSNVNASVNPSQIWNGQALNNQVAPGNRANNYWDNFRSYSRQNLLSTSSKSNDGLQNSTSERLNTSTERAHSFSLPPKLNTTLNESVNLSEDSGTRRNSPFKTSRATSSSNKMTSVPPDVLNINHNTTQKVNDNQDISGVPVLMLNLRMPPIAAQTTHHDETISEQNEINSNVEEPNLPQRRNHNEWHDEEQNDNNLPKSKLFEELRDSVYKEVASLISSNENRPHFLIQLFRDLQLINSDPLRRRTLQSIQNLISQSLYLQNTQGANRQGPLAEQEATYSWPQTSRNSDDNFCLDAENNVDPDIQNILKQVVPFLRGHIDDCFQVNELEALKKLIINSMPFSQIFANTNIQERTFQKHFAAVLTESLEKYQGKRMKDIKKELLKTVAEVLVGEFSFIHLVQENISENCEAGNSANNNQSDTNTESLTLDLQPHSIETSPNEEGCTPQMHNGDLAEADQSRLQLEDEGAVGGCFNVLMVEQGNLNGVPSDEMDLPKIDFADPAPELSEQGLDQVPTRLTIEPRSNRDQSNSSQSDTSEKF